jgi:lauroyl/myristoyl acyltransferase
MANIKEYIDGRNEIFETIAAKQLGGQEIHTHRFNLVSANLLKFLPHIGFDRHFSLYKEIILHNQLSHFEQLYQETFDYVTFENLTSDTMTLMRDRPCIMSSFHFGTYRLLNIFLIKNKIPYTIVIPKAILEKEGETLRKIYANGGQEVDSRFIELESPALGLKMIRELKKGRSLFIYFDGYRGSGDIRHSGRDESEGKIRFLDQTIFARKGVAYLAHTANTPLITAISYRKSREDIRLHFFDPIMPDMKADREKFAQETTQAVYDRFMPFLREFPGQWESWIYLHKSLDCSHLAVPEEKKAVTARPEQGDNERFSFNLSQYGVFKIEEDPFLFNKNTYTTYPIDPATFELLFRSREQTIGKKELAVELFLQLFRERVLIPRYA